MPFTTVKVIEGVFTPDQKAKFIHNITEPVLYPIRSKLPIHYGGIDFSPIIVFLVIIFLRTFVVNSLIRMAASLI